MIPTPLDKQLTGQPRVAISQVSWQPGSHKIYRYVGSFPLSVDVLARKTSSMGSNLPVLRAGYDHGKNVLLEISLQAITISSTECHQVIMSHPLKRISYAICDLASCLCHAVLVVAGGLTRRLSGLQDQLKIFPTMPFTTLSTMPRLIMPLPLSTTSPTMVMSNLSTTAQFKMLLGPPKSAPPLLRLSATSLSLLSRSLLM